MKVLDHKEMNKLECIYCLDYTKRKAEPTSTKKSHVCIHDECPYHELDAFDSYHKYLKSSASVSSIKTALLKIGLNNKENEKNI